MGIASITHGDQVFRFRTDPNSIRWTYTVNTKVDETYGGRVIQILSVKVENLTVTADCGMGGWPYMMEVATAFRDLLVNQRGGAPAVFSYAPRGYKLGCYATAMPFKDSWDAVAREFTMTFKVQEDISGVVTSSSMSAELARLKEGIGFDKTSGYNYNGGDATKSEGGTQPAEKPTTPEKSSIGGIGDLLNPNAPAPGKGLGDLGLPLLGGR